MRKPSVSPRIIFSTLIALSVIYAPPSWSQGQELAKPDTTEPPQSNQPQAGEAKKLDPPNASSPKSEATKTCYLSRPLFGDLAPLGLENWSVGTTLATSVVRYDFSNKKASKVSLATGAGAGIAIRYYGKTYLGSEDDAKKAGFDKKEFDLIKKRYGNDYGDPSIGIEVPLASIAPGCRASTADIGKERTEKLASAIFSITPMVFYSKQTTDTDLNIQPALMVGFLDDIISVGTGFNLAGQERGKMFLLLSLGYGFKF